jgi:hypothetical protein
MPRTHNGLTQQRPPCPRRRTLMMLRTGPMDALALAAAHHDSTMDSVTVTRPADTSHSIAGQASCIAGGREDSLGLGGLSGYAGKATTR